MKFINSIANSYGIHFKQEINYNDKVNENLIRYFKIEYGKEWQSALIKYLSEKKKDNFKKAA